MNSTFDALLIVSFGGPESMDEVVPFLRNVLRGRSVPEERIRQVAKHYELFNGISPINQQNRNLISALQRDFDRHGLHLPIYWGNRNWHPLLADSLRKMRDDRRLNALAFFTSAYSSYSGCRQYRENIEEARAEVGEGAPRVQKLRVFYNHPGFVEPNAEALRKSLERLPEARRKAVHVAFTAHSIPVTMSSLCDYQKQLLETCRLVAESAGQPNWQLVFQSRSGAPGQPWLEPDISVHLQSLRAQGVRDVIVAPIGFISDHLEVIYDLDTEAKRVSEELGLNMIRAATVGTHSRFIHMIRELVMEQVDPNAPRLSLGQHGPSHDVCAADCCLPGIGRPSGQPLK